MKDTTGAEHEDGIEKGQQCGRNGCLGIIDEHVSDKSCSCHISPPCSHCTEDRHFCPVCDWQGSDGEREHKLSEANKEYYKNEMEKWRKNRELFYQKFRDGEGITKLEMRREPHTHFTQIVRGIFPKGTETRETLLSRVNGSFGGRWNILTENKFEFIAYTD